MEGCQGSGWYTTSHKHQEKDCFFVGGSLCDHFKLCGYFKLLFYKTAYGTLCSNNVPGLLSQHMPITCLFHCTLAQHCTCLAGSTWCPTKGLEMLQVAAMGKMSQIKYFCVIVSSLLCAIESNGIPGMPIHPQYHGKLM